MSVNHGAFEFALTRLPVDLPAVLERGRNTQYDLAASEATSCAVEQRHGVI